MPLISGSPVQKYLCSVKPPTGISPGTAIIRVEEVERERAWLRGGITSHFPHEQLGSNKLRKE